ncbi:polysaccharide pyruvyl transferase family protein [Azoarcus sp. L1K30]|uniref:polysaccharide pyruvyl transferase family protein n=1 Tax=Azoarcus sp. L1K30 TaxID=2820277 RepID=UPI001B8210CF|nr:polysaccharide pyruvyl transferase family protein [Azoarcus sp. L1K30]MBR0564507.1 polysaccharide pyruvyl transferase family protein [Azoarcus sp. L1K30]
MKIGVLTFHLSENFGALLQAYSLRKWLMDEGHAVEFVNYAPAHLERGGEFRNLLNPKYFKSNLKTLYLQLTSSINDIFRNAAQESAYAEFRLNQLGVHGAPESRISSLMESIDSYDLLITGSDQVWNPSAQIGIDPAYFLHFDQRPRARRISYAASFGRDELNARFHDEARGYLLDLDAISVREKSGVDIVRAISGRDSACVPDPTILLGDFSCLVKQSTDDREGHVFCYALRSASGVRAAAHLAAKQFSTNIISPNNPHRRWREIGRTVFPGPADWVAQLSRAKFVVTNSFHGVALSLVMKRPFVSIGLPGSRAGMSARARNLLSSVGLMSRMLPADASVRAISEVIDAPVDWGRVDSALQQLREQGESFLRSHLVGGIR